MISRRELVTGVAALVAHANAKSAALRNGEILPDPDFTQLRDKNPYLIGVRPYRPTGVRLELVPEPLNGKRLVHNYGHGGAGITLSWGCASVVCDLVQPLVTKDTTGIAVLGTGMVGLTAATELQRKLPKVPITVYAKSLDLSTTVSWVAGGQFEPSGMQRCYTTPEQKKVVGDYLRRARDRIVEIQNGGKRQQYGVAVRNNYTVDREVPALDVVTPRDVIAAPKKGKLPFAKLNGAGREYQTYLMTPAIIMPKLVEDLRAANVKLEERAFETPDDVAKLPQSIIVNCTGYGSKKLFGDETLIAQRGHNVVLKKTDDKQFYFFSGGCENGVIAYTFCRQDDIVIGGTLQPNLDSPARVPEDDAIFARLLSNGQALFGGQGMTCVATSAATADHH
ncbi:MAG: FAD-binding oxidoreductase [Myxococcaceae bacterium]|nr:FAD-binding oxidoreductase [Myxococcaceae bacterium]